MTLGLQLWQTFRNIGSGLHVPITDRVSHSSLSIIHSKAFRESWKAASFTKSGIRLKVIRFKQGVTRKEGLIRRMKLFDLEMSGGGFVSWATAAQAILLVICLEVMEIVGCG